MTAYYNEFDPFAAAWLRELIKADLIAAGDVDERSITEVTAADLAGYTQCHFFAGIAGWAYSLRLAGWPDERECWTGSCPCQPWSVAGENQGADDSRDLWPAWRRLISERQPVTVFGEQVASVDAILWADRTAEDMEGMGYAFGAFILPATCVGAPHQRDRFYFVADSGCPSATGRSEAKWRRESRQEMARPWAFQNWQGGNSHDGSVDDGISGGMAKSIAGGFGNAIVPQVAAEVIRAYMDVVDHVTVQS